MLSSADQDVQITAGERAVLAASAKGLTVEEVGKLLDRPPSHVRGLIASAVAALGACSKLEAVVLAIELGLID